MILTRRASLERIRQKINGRVRLVLHGTNSFPEDVMQKCIKGGVTKFNFYYCITVQRQSFFHYINYR